MNTAEDRIRQLTAEVATLQEILDHAYECIVVVDRDGYITRMNRTYEEFLNIPPGSALGRHVADVIENTRMHVVANTGVPEIGWTQKIRGVERIVQRIPIIRDGEMVGAVGKFMFKDIEELRALSERVGLLESKVKLYEQELKKIRGARFTFDHIIGQAPTLDEAKQLALKAAQSQASILLLGESGTGKDLFAHAIHHSSSRAAAPFVRLNCAAIPPDLLEAELFGYEEGAFTGARKGGKPGKLELAHKGTIFLDEIADMPLAMQAKILRAVQDREVERVGGVNPVRVDVRIIAATNADLERRVAEGRFREDLFYRLNVISIRLPPLRERPSDIPVLVRQGMARIAEEQGLPLRRLSPGVLDLFLRYDWPGNVRELFNLLERLLATTDGPEIGAADLPPGMARRLAEAGAGVGAGVEVGRRQPEWPAAPPPTASGRLEQSVAETERQVLADALARARGRKAEAARILGIHRSTLYDKLHRLGMG